MGLEARALTFVSRRCIVCDRPEPFRPLYERGGFTLVRCPSCGLVFQHPVPSSEAMATLYYDDEELARSLESELRGFALSRAREKLSLLETAGVTPAGGELLDVGCSSGAWLEVARDAGWSVVGVELGLPFASRARDKGLEVYTGTLEDAAGSALRGRTFNLITFWDVLEHLPDPLGALELARDLMRPQGTVALTAPNIDGLYPRWTYRLLARSTGVWEHPELPAHLYDFSPRTAARLLSRAGLEPAAATTTQVPFWYYRETSLRNQLTPRSRRGWAVRWGFEALRALAYPIARATDRGNALFMTARR